MGKKQYCDKQSHNSILNSAQQNQDLPQQLLRKNNPQQKRLQHVMLLFASKSSGRINSLNEINKKDETIYLKDLIQPIHIIEISSYYRIQKSLKNINNEQSYQINKNKPKFHKFEHLFMNINTSQYIKYPRLIFKQILKQLIGYQKNPQQAILILNEYFQKGHHPEVDIPPNAIKQKLI